jgi:hypothetical protein
MFLEMPKGKNDGLFRNRRTEEIDILFKQNTYPVFFVILNTVDVTPTLVYSLKTSGIVLQNGQFSTVTSIFNENM